MAHELGRNHTVDHPDPNIGSGDLTNPVSKLIHLERPRRQSTQRVMLGQPVKLSLEPGRVKGHRLLWNVKGGEKSLDGEVGVGCAREAEVEDVGRLVADGVANELADDRDPRPDLLWDQRASVLPELDRTFVGCLVVTVGEVACVPFSGKVVQLEMGDPSQPCLHRPGQSGFPVREESCEEDG